MENMGIGAGLGAIGFWFFVAAIIVAGIWSDIRKRESKHETIRRIIESGQPMDQTLMADLLGGNRHLNRDLRVSGLIVLYLAPGMALLGWFISLQEAKALLPLIGVAALLGCLGIGLLVASKFVARTDQADEVPVYSKQKR